MHTGQHYDYSMSQQFFDEMNIPSADINLAVGSGSHGYQLGQMIIKLEEVINDISPDIVVVHGDTNSTLAGALVACKSKVLLAHNEAGLRSFNKTMPEEDNRVLTDHCSDILLCPTQTAVDQLSREGITDGVHLVGDVMYDAALEFQAVADKRSTILTDLKLSAKEYLLVTVHRPYNTDNRDRLGSIMDTLARTDETVILPLHPRTSSLLIEYGIKPTENVQLIDPVGYLDMITLERNARMILTDSGGIQKEAYFYRVPCVTLRPETEWIETVAEGWNRVVDTDPVRILDAVRGQWWPKRQLKIFGNGKASQIIVEILEDVA